MFSVPPLIKSNSLGLRKYEHVWMQNPGKRKWLWAGHLCFKTNWCSRTETLSKLTLLHLFLSRSMFVSVLLSVTVILENELLHKSLNLWGQWADELTLQTVLSETGWLLFGYPFVCYIVYDNGLSQSRNWIRCGTLQFSPCSFRFSTRVNH